VIRGNGGRGNGERGRGNGEGGRDFRLVGGLSLRLSGVFHLTKMGLSGENT